MKRILIITLLAFFTIGLFAQKSVRKSIRRGNTAFKEQRYSAAESEYSKALEENASSKEAAFNLANAYYKQQRYNEAINEYQHYLTVENESPDKMSSAWSNIGNSYLKKKATEKGQGQEGQQQQQPDNLKMSMEAYKNALRLNPLDDETRENLAIVQKMIEDEEGEGGGEDDDQEQNQDQDQQQDQQDQQDQKDQDQQQDDNKMSQENIQQILEAIEQDERETQQKVNDKKSEERKEKMDRNRRQDKDW